MARRLIAWGTLIAGLAALAGWLWRVDIGAAIFRHAIEAVLRTNPVEGQPDGLSVALCGAGSPMPAPDRLGPCTVVTAGRHVFAVDAGEGAVRGITRLGYSAGQVEAVFLTHPHSDHLDGLGGLMLQRWATANAHAALPLYGPPAVTRIAAGFNEAYAVDAGYRIAHHGPAVVPPEGYGLAPRPVGVGQVFAADGLVVTSVLVPHGPVKPAYGYVFAYKGRRLVISGDSSPSRALEQAARGADVLVHEALSPRLVAEQRAAALAAGKPMLARILADIPGYHTSPPAAADIARRARVQVLLLTHIIPPLPYGVLEPAFLGDARARFPGRLIVGQDGDELFMPVGSDRIEYRRRF